MGFKKKKNIITLTIIVVISFILYQLYFFWTISSATTSERRIIQPVDRTSAPEAVHTRSQEDKYINENGVIRGVLFKTMPRFRPDSKNEFKCLKSEQHIPFDQVNDDFCDCEDSTDEPSTTACVKGVFYCDLQYGSKPNSINSVPSSKVNDGICDCCDGSDEWDHKKNARLLMQGCHFGSRDPINRPLGIPRFKLIGGSEHRVRRCAEHNIRFNTILLPAQIAHAANIRAAIKFESICTQRRLTQP